jgi:putative heme degradation protein
MTPSRLHEILTGANPAQVLQTLPDLGRVMVIARAGGATHERIGPVAEVAITAQTACVSGPCHDATVQLDCIAQVHVDRSSVMKEKVYPRLSFVDARGDVLFAVVGMDGVEGFDAALGRFPADPRLPAPVTPTPLAELAEHDPALAPFAQVEEAGAAVTITATATGITQAWRGTISAIKPAMGFVNVITGDFHLHLSGGSVSGWAKEPGRRVALGADGLPTGLTLSSQVFA